jgi:hypothetical protein
VLLFRELEGFVLGLVLLGCLVLFFGLGVRRRRCRSLQGGAEFGLPFCLGCMPGVCSLWCSVRSGVGSVSVGMCWVWWFGVVPVDWSGFGVAVVCCLFWLRGVGSGGVCELVVGLDAVRDGFLCEFLILWPFSKSVEICRALSESLIGSQIW